MIKRRKKIVVKAVMEDRSIHIILRIRKIVKIRIRMRKIKKKCRRRRIRRNKRRDGNWKKRRNKKLLYNCQLQLILIMILHSQKNLTRIFIGQFLMKLEEDQLKLKKQIDQERQSRTHNPD